MTAYNITYSVDNREYNRNIDAKDIKSAKMKLGKKHGYKTGRNIDIKEVKVVGYF